MSAPKPVSNSGANSAQTTKKSLPVLGRKRDIPTPPVSAYLPTNLAEANARGWDPLDIVLINGDASVDHPTFGVPLIGRLLASHGDRVGIISQPDGKDPEHKDLKACGKPRLFFGISSGNMDSRVCAQRAGREPSHGIG